MSICRIRCSQSVVIKYGIRNIPDKTRLRRSWRVVPSNGKAPQTNTYKTTPKLCNTNNYSCSHHIAWQKNLIIFQKDESGLTHTSAFGPSYSFPSNSSGAA